MYRVDLSNLRTGWTFGMMERDAMVSAPLLGTLAGKIEKLGKQKKSPINSIGRQQRRVEKNKTKPRSVASAPHHSRFAISLRVIYIILYYTI